MATIQIPVLFDMSGDTITYGEEISGDFIYSHLNFMLDMTTEANDISLNAADISGTVLVGDNDYTDNIFYSGGSSGNIAVDNLCNRIAKTITRGKLVHLPHTGNSSNSGIPMGGRAQLVSTDGTTTGNGALDKYAIKYLTSISPIGDEQMLGEAMARVASIHLVGSPLSAGIFENKNSVQTDLEVASGQTFNSGNTAFYNALAVQLSKVLGGSKSSAPMNNGSGTPLDTAGVSVPALKSIYEQLMNVPGRSQIMETREVTNVPMPSDTNIPGGFPFIAGDKLVMYLRPKINFAGQTLPEQHTGNIVGMPEEVGFSVPVYDIGRKNSDGGALTGQTYTQSSMYNSNTDVGFNKCFEGTEPDTSSYWLTAGTGGNNPATDHRYGSNGGAYIGGSHTRFVGEPKDITVTTAKLQNTNEVIDTAANSFGINEGFVYYYDLQVGDTITYEHPVSGTTTTTVASVVLDGNSKPFKITLTDAHDATANNVSLTFNNKENLMGEWGQVDIGQNTAVKQIDLWPYPPAQASDIPKNFHLLGSADGTNWDILKKVVNEDWGLVNAGGIKEYTLTPAGPYRYYRISVQLLVNNTSNNNFSLSQMVIWGGKHPTEFYRHALPLDISGLVTNFTATPENITSAFPGKNIGGPFSEDLKWGWMGSTTNNILTQDTTDITDTNTIDLHVWKITITL